ncbi:MAG: hypothetical protein FJ264_10435 [Planctomycetes bacterium]|nr:hypothetical protein [Planctomycetota bacterium]
MTSANYSPAETIPLLLSGGIRGIIVDFLWVRALARHEEKKYYELLTINNSISKLQPDFPAVWIFQAWNMAYNIAHEWDSPQNKWKWIKAGLHFAKKGASKNPHNGDLFFELGYMYSHLFDERYFKYSAYNRKQLKKEEGEDNYDASLFWMRKSVLNAPKLRNITAIERYICHTLWKAALCAETEGRYDNALEYVESAVKEWKAYHEKHPQDTLVDVHKVIKRLEEKKMVLQDTLQKTDTSVLQNW